VRGVSGPEGLPPTVARGRCLVMGVLNVTPDSFSDGGRWLDPGAAVAHGLAMAADGADLVDVGGESTRPGAGRVPVEEELRRVVPVVRDLAGAGVAVSVDTMRAPVARAALDAGAVLVNDVSGGHADPAMPAVVAAAGVPFVATHWRDSPGPDQGGLLHAQEAHRYADVVAEVVADLRDSVDGLAAAGVDRRRVVIDPGLGFAKNPTHNWALLARLDALVAEGLPVLVGASRKRFLGNLLAAPGTAPVPVDERDGASAAITALAAEAGVWCVRVHDVRPSADAVRVVAALASARSVAAPVPAPAVAS
jgi:dihydropteroate synthase